MDNEYRRNMLDNYIKVIEAFKSGKTVQYLDDGFCENGLENDYSDWHNVEDYNHLLDLIGHQYEMRVKPEHKLRPYKNSDEFIDAQKKHGMWLKNEKYGWKMLLPVHIQRDLTDNGDEVDTVFMLWSSKNELMTGYTYKDILRWFVWYDGTECGTYEDE